jgi:uncharacterized protein YraI
MGKGWVAFAVFLSAAPAVAQESVEVTASTLNVRSGPGIGYSDIGNAYGGQSYVAIATSGSWRQIWYSGTTAWVSAAYVASSSAPVGTVTAGTLNVRSGPGTGYDIVGTVPQGSKWAIVGSSGAWRKICYKGAYRWVHGNYLNGTSSGSGLPTSSVGFVQLPASGPGFYCYSPSTRRWGTPAMVYGFMNAAASWDAQHDWPRIGVGDLSLQNGGPISGHVSHQVGKDVDLRPVRVDNVEGPTVVGYASYSHARTKDLITHHLKLHLNVKVIFFNDPNIYNPLSYVQYWDNHYNHLHVRIY